MADDKYYVPGSWYYLDDRTGFKTRSYKARERWDGVMTSGTHWDPRQPQDLVQGVPDDQSVPWVRPRQTNQFTVLATVVIAFAGRGSLSMEVQSTQGFSIGDVCQVPLDNGDLFQFVLSAVGNGALSWTSPPLPGTVGSSIGDPIENTVLDLTASPPLVPAPINP